MTRISKSRMDMEGGGVNNAYLRDYGESAVIDNSGTSYTIDLTQANTYHLTMTGNCTFAFSNPPAAGIHASFTLMLTQDGTAGRTATWPSSVVWSNGITPNLTATANNTDVFTFTTYDGGGNWYGFEVAQNLLLPQTYIKFGYFATGGPVVSTVDRIDYSNDTATAVAKGPVSLARFRVGSAGNSAFGYLGGGYIASPVTAYSRVDRIDYSNDTATAASKGPLTAARYWIGSTGTSASGYFGGGKNGTPIVSTVDRIDYSNDTATAVAKGPLSGVRTGVAGTGHSAFGYFGGGTASPSFTPALTLVDRIDYSNDTPALTTKGPLSLARWAFSATGNSSFGYFAGGYTASPATTYTRVDRIDYSNDTATAVAKGPLSTARFAPGGVGTSVFGYFGGGSPSPAAVTSVIDRIDYSNDTPTAAVQSHLSVARTYTAGLNHTAL
ncbi:MAG TPA: hypothetical protein VG753_02130 [Candidatus Paceibacterota bacterium]|nr:hypothetical protein [Candidatus Paceibacterota bacterium]